VNLIPGYRDDKPDRRAELVDIINRAFRAFAEAGCKDIYAVVTLRSRSDPIGVVVPIAEGISDERLRQLQGGDLQWRRLHGAFFTGAVSIARRVADGPPDPRPDLIKAFEAAGDTDGQILLVPPKHTARVVQEMIPTLPKELGGGPSSVYVRGIKWAAVGLNTSPEMSMRLVVQSEDKEAAEALREKWLENMRLLGKNKDVRKLLPDFDELARQLTPKLEGDRLTIALDKQATAALVKAIETLATPTGDRKGP
jgi:hypothetical protein